jgi:hypothetical protein
VLLAAAITVTVAVAVTLFFAAGTGIGVAQLAGVTRGDEAAGFLQIAFVFEEYIQCGIDSGTIKVAYVEFDEGAAPNRWFRTC